MSKSFATVEIDSASFNAADAQLARLEFEVRTSVLEKGVRAAAAPVVMRARQLAPDSVKSGSRSRWSKKLKAARQNTKQHKDTIGVSSIRHYRGSTVAIYAGPLHPAGNLINAIGHPHNQVLWGRHTGVTLPPTDYLQRAANETKAEQQSAFVAKITSESEKLLNHP
jgi:hypothetical protein